ncbi:MAG: T9SS type A sorting domain-containing protein [candidate division Zixibacteria bacterium]|nr:T9SS type A sorting domain-containing protein [candidate division Zixibacteria bacterium]
MRRKFKLLLIPMLQLLLIFVMTTSVSFGNEISKESSSLKNVCIGGITIGDANNHTYPELPNPFADTTYLFQTPGTWPGGLTWDGTYFWLTDIDSDVIYKLTVEGVVVDSFSPTYDTPSGLAWDGTHLWCVSEQEAMLYKHDPSNGSILESFTLPDSASGDPSSWGLAWDGEYLWHSQYGSNVQIFKLDPANGEVLHSFTPPHQSILGIAWDGTHITGVTAFDHTFYKMDPTTGDVIETQYWEIPYAAGLYHDGENFFNVSSKMEHGGHQAVYGAHIETSHINDIDGVPQNYDMITNYPNPFNAATNISFNLMQSGVVNLSVYNLMGQNVETLINNRMDKGQHNINWDASTYSSGIYFYKLTTNNNTFTKRMTLLK